MSFMWLLVGSITTAVVPEMLSKACDEFDYHMDICCVSRKGHVEQLRKLQVLYIEHYIQPWILKCISRFYVRYFNKYSLLKLDVLQSYLVTPSVATHLRRITFPYCTLALP